MQRKLRISAESVEALRLFLAGTDVDVGCRPVARSDGDLIGLVVVADESEVPVLAARAGARVLIERLEPLPSRERRLARVATGNRFLAGAAPRGVAIRE